MAISDNIIVRAVARVLPPFIKRDFFRKFIAFILALVVYYVVLSQLGGDRIVGNVAVTVLTPSSLVALEDKPQMVSLQVRGSDRTLKRLTESDFAIEVKIDESKFVPKKSYSVSIEPKDVKAPFGVTVVRVNPATLHLDFDKLISKTVALRAAFDPDSKLPAGYAVSRAALTPSDVRITGPSSIVDKIEFMQTRPIPLGSITQAFEYSSEIAVSSPTVKVSPSKTLVQVDVIKESDIRLFKNVAIRTLKSSGFKRFSVEMLSAPNAEISVYGPKGVVELIRDDEIKPYIDISSFDQAGAYTVNVNCWLEHEGVSVRSIYPQTVRIKLIDSGDGR